MSYTAEDSWAGDAADEVKRAATSVLPRSDEIGRTSRLSPCESFEPESALRSRQTYMAAFWRLTGAYQSDPRQATCSANFGKWRDLRPEATASAPEPPKIFKTVDARGAVHFSNRLFSARSISMRTWEASLREYRGPPYTAWNLVSNSCCATS